MLKRLLLTVFLMLSISADIFAWEVNWLFLQDENESGRIQFFDDIKTFAEQAEIGVYAIPVYTWLNLPDQNGSGIGLSDDTGYNDWQWYAMGMAVLIGTKIGDNLEKIARYIPWTNDNFDVRPAPADACRNWLNTAHGKKMQSYINGKIFDTYINNLFRHVKPLATKIRNDYDERPNTAATSKNKLIAPTSASDLTASGFVKVTTSVQAETVSIYNVNTISYTTAPVAKTWAAKWDANLKDNDVYAKSSGSWVKLNKSDNYFRHGFKILTGVYPAITMYGADDLFYGANNPLNPFDPADSWGYVTNPLPEVYKQVKALSGGNVLVFGNDCQPYYYQKSNDQTYGYIMRYREGARCAAASGTDLYFVDKDNNILTRPRDMTKQEVKQEVGVYKQCIPYNRGNGHFGMNLDWTLAGMIDPRHGNESVGLPATNRWGNSYHHNFIKVSDDYRVRFSSMYDSRQIRGYGDSLTRLKSSFSPNMEYKYNSSRDRADLVDVSSITNAHDKFMGTAVHPYDNEYMNVRYRNLGNAGFDIAQFDVYTDKGFVAVYDKKLYFISFSSISTHSQINGIDNVCRVSVDGTGNILVLKFDGSVVYGKTKNLDNPSGDNVQWNDLNIKALDCELGKGDGTIAVVTGSGDIYTLTADKLQQLVPGVEAEKVTNGMNKQLVSGDKRLSVATSGMVYLSDTGNNLTIVKHAGAGNGFSLKTKDDKYIGASTSSTTPAAANTQIMGNLANADDKKGHWFIVDASAGKFYLQEAISRRFVGLGTSNNNLILLNATTTGAVEFSFTEPIAESISIPTAGGGVTPTPVDNVDRTATATDFSAYIASVDAAQTTVVDGTSLFAEYVKIILLAATTGLWVNDKTTLASIVTTSTTTIAEANVTKTLLQAVANISTGGAPSALGSVTNAETVADKLKTIGKQSTAQDKINAMPGIAQLLLNALDRLFAAFGSNAAITTAKSELSDLYAPLGVTDDANAVQSLQDSLINVTTDKSATSWVASLNKLVTNRVDLSKENLEKLINLITTRLIGGTSNAAQRVVTKVTTDDLNTKLATLNTPPTINDVITRLETLKTPGSFSPYSKSVFASLAGCFLDVSIKDANILTRAALTIDKRKTLAQRAVNVFQAAKLIDSTLTEADAALTAMQTIVAATDFKTNFIDNVRALFNQSNATATPATLDSDGLWQADPVPTSEAKTASGINPKTFYTLEMFWNALKLYVDWNADLDSPANKYPLISMCKRVKNSIEKYFSSQAKYTTILAEVNAKLTALQSS